MGRRPGAPPVPRSGISLAEAWRSEELGSDIGLFHLRNESRRNGKIQLPSTGNGNANLVVLDPYTYSCVSRDMFLAPSRLTPSPLGAHASVLQDELLQRVGITTKINIPRLSGLVQDLS